MTNRRAAEIQAIIRKMKADMLDHLRIVDGLIEEIERDRTKAKPKRRSRSGAKKRPLQ